MEIGQIGAGSLLGTSINQPGVPGSSPATSTARGGSEVVPRALASAGGARSEALNILRQEIRQVLRSSFRINFIASAPGYGQTTGVNVDDVAGDALNGAAAAAQRSPLRASRALVNLREQVEASAREVRELVGDDDDVDDALSRINGGLDDLDDDAARNVQSSATVLSAESRLKQRSTIRIRTQEGDVVRFDLRRVEKMSVQDSSFSDGNSFSSSTEIELSSRSRMRLRVQGDLNEAEYAAVQNVFAQAEAIADEFFGGDLVAAFDMAAGIEFDSEQLARVNMRFREKLESEVSYATTGPVLSRPVPKPTPLAGTTETVEPIRAVPPIEPAPVAPTEIKQPITAVPVAEAPVANAESVTPGLADGALDGFLGLLSDFLRGVSEGFEPEGNATSFRFFYSQSFNLEILRSVLEFKAADDDRSAAQTAMSLVDGIAESGDDD